MFLRRFLGPIIAQMVMPSQTLANTMERKDGLSNGAVMSYFNTPSSAKAVINFCEVASVANSKKDIKEQKIIINAVGNYDIYETYCNDEYINDAKKYPDCRIVGFNFRNVQASKGHVQSEEDWIDDVLAVVNYYRDRGVPLENIMLRGHSLGAAIVTMAAAKIYRDEKTKDAKKAKSVKLLNGRSFSSLTQEVIELVLGSKGSGIIAAIFYGLLGIIASKIALAVSPLLIGLTIGAVLVGSGFLFDRLPKALAKPWIGLMLWLSFGRMDALTAYRELPEDAKDYIVVKGDGIIIEPAGLHDGLKPALSQRKQVLRDLINNQSDAVKSKDLNDELTNIKDSKLVYTPLPFDGMVAHNAHLSEMSTCHKLRGVLYQISANEVVANKTKRLLKIK